MEKVGIGFHWLDDEVFQYLYTYKLFMISTEHIQFHFMLTSFQLF